MDFRHPGSVFENSHPCKTQPFPVPSRKNNRVSLSSQKKGLFRKVTGSLPIVLAEKTTSCHSLIDMFSIILLHPGFFFPFNEVSRNTVQEWLPSCRLRGTSRNKDLKKLTPL